MADGMSGPSIEEAGLTSKDIGVVSSEVTETWSELRQNLIDNIGFIPRSTSEVAKISRGVFNKGEAGQIKETGYGFDRLGFDGNGEYLSFDEDKALSQIGDSHRGSHIIEFFAIPNIRKEVVQAFHGKRPPVGFVEGLFARPRAVDEQVGSSGVNPNPDLILDSQFFEGYFDKSTNEWVPNSNYWENKLKEQRVTEGWSEEEYQKNRQLKYEEIKADARQKLNSEINKY